MTIKNPELDVADAVLFTETYRKKYIERLKEIEERRKEIGSRSLSKQISARLNRKIKGNIELRNKMELLKDLQENKILVH